ncbi:hypothetical protein [Corynebacterium sp.]|uniref:hypothetical protein n=1 Tax=Corynebacterium sp. TaxID=1720 RepID=UPI003B3AC50D
MSILAVGRAQDGGQAEAVGDQVVQVTGDAEPYILRGLLRRPLLQVSLVVSSFRAGLERRTDRQHRAQHRDDGHRRGEPGP